MVSGPTGVVAKNRGAGRRNPTGGQLRVEAGGATHGGGGARPTEIDPLYLFGRCVAWELRKPSPIRRGNFSPLHKVPEDDCRFGRLFSKRESQAEEFA